jgi:hypothetical protein
VEEAVKKKELFVEREESVCREKEDKRKGNYSLPLWREKSPTFLSISLLQFFSLILFYSFLFFSLTSKMSKFA